jgi:hypothetical protein
MQARIEQSKADATQKGPEFLKNTALTWSAERQYEEVLYKLKLLKMGGGEAWARTQLGVAKAFDELKTAVGKALEKF